MVLKMLFVVFLDNKYSIFSSQSQLIYPDKEMFIFSFVLRCKSTRLFFPPPRNLAQLLFFFFSSKKMVSTFHQFPTPDNTKLVEIFVFLLNLFRLEFEVETKRTGKH